ncbi:pre-mRNA 3' end processing protein WDR33-like isoform X2 [Bolinopsis microptera]|uniref:pre-mRNA 3' end processing protein WDR33-like isoform X2 n=1 Tax=Bolinopsis microptera TaxID=2820187 RepID=UPI00307A9F1B
MVSMMNPMVYVRNQPEAPVAPAGELPKQPSMMGFPFQQGISSMPGMPPMPPNMQGMQLTPMFFPSQMSTFDGKRMRRSVQRKTVDYNAPVFEYIEDRLYKKSLHGSKVLQPHKAYYIDMMPPMGMLDNPMNAVTTRFVRMSTNKFKCPIHLVRWTTEGRRLVTGTSNGEFTLWNGLTFNFETILQAHDTALRVMEWNKNETWLLTADHTGNVKYWQSNMNNVKSFDAHTEVIRDASFCPTDKKFVTCSDDSLVKIWDFHSCTEERAMRGHGAEVKCCDWHPQKGLIVSGSKDTQQPIKLWDPRVGQSLTTLHLHKATVTRAKWNRNGNWLLTSSRDHLLKIFDIRAMKEMQVFRGHKKEVMSISWHPIHEGLFASGGADGSILFWIVGTDREVGGMDTAHEGMVLSLDWHPLGHILASGSNDHTAKFWTRNRPGDLMQDKYNLNTNPNEGLYDQTELQDLAIEDPHGLQMDQEPVILDSKVIPGMGETQNLQVDDNVINTLAPSKVISKSNEKTSSKSLHQILPMIRTEVVPGLQISTEKMKGELEIAATVQNQRNQNQQNQQNQQQNQNQQQGQTQTQQQQQQQNTANLTSFNANDEYGFDQQGTYVEQGNWNNTGGWDTQNQSNQNTNKQTTGFNQPPPPGQEPSTFNYNTAPQRGGGPPRRTFSNEGQQQHEGSVSRGRGDGSRGRRGFRGGDRGSFRGRGDGSRPYPDPSSRAEVSLQGVEIGDLTEGLVSVVTPEEEETEEELVVVVVTGVGAVVISGVVVEEAPLALSPAISGLTLIGLERHVEQCAVRTDSIDLGSVFKMTVYWRV